MTDILINLGNSLAEWIVEQIPVLNTLHPWAFWAVMVVAAVVLSQLVALVIDRFVLLFTKRTKTQVDDIIVERIHQPFAWLIFSVLIYVAFGPLPLDNAWIRITNGMLFAFNVIVIGWLVHRLLDALFTIWDELIAKRTESVLDDTMLPIISKFFKALVWIIAGLIILASWGVQIAPFLAGLGIAGIAIGFAVKDSLANIFGGISLALDHAYRVGDKVKVNNILGVVHDITLRSTRIRTYDGDMIMIPNGVIANENIYTFAQPAPKSRGQVNFGVEYGSDVDKVKQIILKQLEAVEKIEKDPAPSVLFMRMGDFALEFRAYFWLANYTDVFSTEREVTDRIYKVLNKSRIRIPFPTSTVYLKK